MYFTNWKSNERTKANDCKIWNHQYINVSRHTNLCYFGVLWILALLRRGNFWINNFKSSAGRLVSSKLIQMILLRFRVFGWSSKHWISNSIRISFFREAQSTKVTMACAVFLTYPLQAYPAVEILLPMVQKRFSERYYVAVELVFRYCLVVFTCKFFW